MVQEDNIPEQRDTAAEVPWLRKVVNDEGIEIQAIDDNDVQNLVAIADANGCLHLGRNQPDDSSYSHKSPTSIRNLRFTSDGRHLLTVGGRDSCLIQLEIKL